MLTAAWTDVRHCWFRVLASAFVSEPKVGWTDLTALFAPASVTDLADTKGCRLQSASWQTLKSLVISIQPASESATSPNRKKSPSTA